MVSRQDSNPQPINRKSDALPIGQMSHHSTSSVTITQLMNWRTPAALLTCSSQALPSAVVSCPSRSGLGTWSCRCTGLLSCLPHTTTVTHIEISVVLARYVVRCKSGGHCSSFLFNWPVTVLATCYTSCSSLLVTCVTAVCEIPGLNPIMSSLCICHKNHCDIRPYCNV